MKFKSEFLNEINERGFIYQHTEIEDLDYIVSKNNIAGYIGFDITSDSIHVGSLIQLMLLHWLDFYGHKSIALIFEFFVQPSIATSPFRASTPTPTIFG